MENIQISICDDEQVQMEFLSASVKKWAKKRDFVAEISVYESGECFLYHQENMAGVDILLLDIQMKGMDGIALARQIRKKNEDVSIIFITGYPEYIAEGYEVSALHYLMKPLKEEKLFEVLDRAVVRIQRAEKSLLLTSDEQTLRIRFSDILYAEVFAHKSVIYTRTKAVETNKSLKELEKDLGSGFICCHCSYLVGIAKIRRITKTQILLEGDKIVPLSRRRYMLVN